MGLNKICMILLAVLILAVPVGAKPENVVMGPYKVSFDIGNVGYYTINLEPPSKSENFESTPYTLYEAFINGTSPLQVSIGIQSYSMPVLNNAEGAIRSTLKSISQTCGEPIITTRRIDGKPGALGIVNCTGSKMNMFLYPLDYYPENKTMTSDVVIISTYPWNGGTSALVKTIHVEKA